MAEVVQIIDDSITEVVTIVITDASEIELTNDGTFIKWRREGSDVWTNLIEVDSLRPGPAKYISNEIALIQNTAAETSVSAVADYQGSRNIVGGTALKGDIYKVFSTGSISTGNGQSTTLRVKIGSTVLIASTELLPNNLVDKGFIMQAEIRIVAGGVNGLVELTGVTFIQTTQGVATPVMRFLNANDLIPVDLSVDNLLDITYQWGTALAANVLKVKNVDICKLRVI